MILFDNTFKKLRLDEQVPVLFTGSADHDFSSAFVKFQYDFLSAYNNGIGEFILFGSRKGRTKAINKITYEEYLFLSTECGYKEPTDVLDNTLNAGHIRVFKVDAEFPLGYKTMNFTYKSPIDEKINHCVSLFVGKNFDTDDNGDTIRLLYDLIEAYVDAQLCDYGVQFNHLVATECTNRCIVMDRHLSPSDAIFIVRYFCCIFSTFISATDNSHLTKSFELLFRADRPYLMPISKYDMVKIYSYCHDDIYEAVGESDFLYLCNIVLVATLITNTSITIPESDSDSEGE